jgi:hypothetical protein
MRKAHLDRRPVARPAPGRPPNDGGVWRLWIGAWPGMVLIALANGTLRALVTQPVLGETPARLVATVVLLAALLVYQRWLLARRPLPTLPTALAVGAAWTVLTLAFEFGFGRFVERLSWSTMLADYDVTNGRIWVLVPLWLLVGPAVLGEVESRRR